tara:strand:+ start:44780 stop:46132 length:1353 start_codon:yes stop_codon:yes gene_type:complete
MNNKIAVVGSGITGLSTAYSLDKNGFDVSVFEKNSEPGGAIKTVIDGEWLTEYGPNTVLIRDKILADLFTDLDLDNDIMVANRDASKRYIVKNSELVSLPQSMMEAVSSPLLTTKSKLRLLKEPFLSANPNRDQSIAEFIERRLGREILDYAVNPFVAGIFANRPENLSLRHTMPKLAQLEEIYGSVIWGGIASSIKTRSQKKIDRSLISFKKGLQTLPIKIASVLKSIYYDHKVTALEKREEYWHLTSNGKSFGPYGHVIINVPLYQIGEILNTFLGHRYAFEKEVDYPELSVLHLGYKKEDIQHKLDGFGFLVPEVENRSVLGALFSSTLFEGRSPKDSHLLTVFVGGGRDPKLAEMDTNKLVKMVEEELKELIGLRGSYQYMDHVYWPKSIPAYHLGYDEILNQFNQIENKYRGLKIAGNFRNGVSVPDCIKNGLKLAETLKNQLRH